MLLVLSELIDMALRSRRRCKRHSMADNSDEELSDLSDAESAELKNVMQNRIEQLEKELRERDKIMLWRDKKQKTFEAAICRKEVELKQMKKDNADLNQWMCGAPKVIQQRAAMQKKLENKNMKFRQQNADLKQQLSALQSETVSNSNSKKKSSKKKRKVNTWKKTQELCEEKKVDQISDKDQVKLTIAAIGKLKKDEGADKYKTITATKERVAKLMKHRNIFANTKDITKLKNKIRVTHADGMFEITKGAMQNENHFQPTQKCDESDAVLRILNATPSPAWMVAMKKTFDEEQDDVH